mgnify:CR=1 FL=1
MCGDACSAKRCEGGRLLMMLCDGMGTGLGAVQEGKAAAKLLRQLLVAGYPARYALQSLNSLCALRGRAGAVTVGLVELELDTGRATLYQWGAPPAWLIKSTGCEKIGTAGPPPGLDITKTRETVDRLSLRRGETLIILSDGVDGEGVRRLAVTRDAGPLGEMADRLLDAGAEDASDDATLALVRLRPEGMLT